MTLPTSVSASMTTIPGPKTATKRRQEEAVCALCRTAMSLTRRVSCTGATCECFARSTDLCCAAKACQSAPLSGGLIVGRCCPTSARRGRKTDMQDLMLHNTLTRRTERFEPIDPSDVRLYVCGPTVYDLAHLGNARPVVVYDVLTRLLRLLYPRVTYVRNITDVDDKINARAKETGEPIASVTARTVADFHADMAALGCLPPDVEPRATAHIPEMIALIERLIASGHAYAADGHVLFAVASFPDYGRLSGFSPDELL